MIRKVFLLSIAVSTAIVVIFIQQFFSVNKPAKEYCKINNTIYTFKLPVSDDGKEGCVIELNIPDTTVSGRIIYKKLIGNDDWTEIRLVRNENLISMLPKQKPNTKLQYYIELNSKGKVFFLAHKKPVILRFQQEVPKFIQYPYMILMFLALVLSIYVGLLALLKIENYKKYSLYVFYLFLGGACVLNLIVFFISFHKLVVRFDANNDLTVYRNLLIFLFWLGVFYINRKKENRYISLFVSIITLLIFILPQNILFHWLL